MWFPSGRGASELAPAQFRSMWPWHLAQRTSSNGSRAPARIALILPLRLLGSRASHALSLLEGAPFARTRAERIRPRRILLEKIRPAQVRLRRVRLHLVRRLPRPNPGGSASLASRASPASRGIFGFFGQVPAPSLTRARMSRGDVFSARPAELAAFSSFCAGSPIGLVLVPGPVARRFPPPAVLVPTAELRSRLEEVRC